MSKLRIRANAARKGPQPTRRPRQNAPSWAALVARKAQLEQLMAGPAAPTPEIRQEYDEVLEAMAENKIFIAVDDLEANAAQRWRQEWTPE